MRIAAAAFLIGVSLSCAAQAQTVPTDLAITVSRSGEQITVSEAPLVTLIATNRGPNAAGDVVVTASLYDVFINRPLAAAISVQPGCPAIVLAETPMGSQLVTTVSWTVGALAVGEVGTCQIRVQALPTAIRGTVQFFARVGSVSTNDIFGNNNVVGLEFGISPITYVRDLQLSINSPTGLLPAGAHGSIDFVLANHGPDNDPVAFDEITVSSPFLISFGDDHSGLRLAFATTDDSDCTVSADDIDGLVNQRKLQMDFRPVAVGTSRTCTLLVEALAGATGQSSLRFTARSNHPGEVDPNPVNNVAFVRVQHTAEPTAIPALSLSSVILLAWMLLVMGSGARRSGG